MRSPGMSLYDAISWYYVTLNSIPHIKFSRKFFFQKNLPKISFLISPLFLSPTIPHYPPLISSCHSHPWTIRSMWHPSYVTNSKFQKIQSCSTMMNQIWNKCQYRMQNLLVSNSLLSAVPVLAVTRLASEVTERSHLLKRGSYHPS